MTRQCMTISRSGGEWWHANSAKAPVENSCFLHFWLLVASGESLADGPPTCFVAAKWFETGVSRLRRYRAIRTAEPSLARALW